MAYLRYKMLQKYINGELQEIYKQGELIDSTEYSTYEECNEGNENPDEPIEGNIYQWVDTSDTMCNGRDKYRVQKQQVSSDRGVTWRDTGETRQGDLIEVDSFDCMYDTMYLTFEALTDGTFTFTNSVQYTLDDGATWTTLNANTATPTVTTGNKIMWKKTSLGGGSVGTFSSTGRFNVYGNIMSMVYGDDFENNTVITGTKFYQLFRVCTNLVSAENLILPSTTLASACYLGMFLGCTSLTTAPKVLPATILALQCYAEMFNGCTSLVRAPQILPATTLADNCYNRMFQNCTSLVNAPILPATTLAVACYYMMFLDCSSLVTAPQLPATTLEDRCYYYMFNGCTSLVTAPQILPTTTLAQSCYYGMFKNCTSLETAPVLPATTLYERCYYSMFYGCTSLETAPDLPATTLADGCYDMMFYDCTNLTYIKCLATDISASGCTTDWVNGVAASGTFVKEASMSSWTTGYYGIPYGWNVINA